MKSSRAIQYWLVKQEPEAYAWEQFEADGSTSWEGVRNFQARNNLRAMKKGDAVLWYASVTTKAVQGLAEVAQEAFPDPSATEGDWSTVILKPVRALPHPVTLETIKATPALKSLALLRQSRLSVTPLTKEEYLLLVKLGDKKPAKA